MHNLQLLREERLRRVTHQLQSLFQSVNSEANSSSGVHDAGEVAAEKVDWCEQKMLLECFLTDRQNLENLSNNHRERFPFLYSNRNVEGEKSERQPDDRGRRKKFTEGQRAAKQQVELDEAEHEDAGAKPEIDDKAAEPGIVKENEPCISHSNARLSTASATEVTNAQVSTSIALAEKSGGVPKAVSTVFNSMDGSLIDSNRFDYADIGDTEDPLNCTIRQASRSHQPQQANLMVWHRYTEIPFDISSSEFSVKTPVLPLVQGGHLVFLTSECGNRKRHYSVKIIKKNSNRSAASSRLTRHRGSAGSQLATITKDEFLVLKKLAHPCVASLFYFCENQSLYYYFFPHYMFANLTGNFSVFNRLGPTACVYVTCCIINTVEYLYRNCIIHRDISAKSVLFNQDGRPVLFHFDYATFHGSLRNSETLVTFLPELSTRAPEVISPEICKNCETEFYVNCDIWGIGVLLGELLLSSKVMTKALKRKLDLHWVFSVRETGDLSSSQMYSGVPKSLMEVLRSCLRKNPQDRPTIHNLMLNGTFKEFGVPNIHNVISHISPMDRMFYT